MLMLFLCYINLTYTQQLSLLYKKGNQTKKKKPKRSSSRVGLHYSVNPPTKMGVEMSKGEL